MKDYDKPVTTPEPADGTKVAVYPFKFAADDKAADRERTVREQVKAELTWLVNHWKENNPIFPGLPSSEGGYRAGMHVAANWLLESLDLPELRGCHECRNYECVCRTVVP